jgi:hypothetical protein
MSTPVLSPLMRAWDELAEQMLDLALKHAPEGNLEVKEDYDGLPYVLGKYVKAIDAFHQNSATQGLDKLVADYIGAGAKAMGAVVVSCEAIPNAIDSAHADELNYLRKAREKGVSERWDVRANRNSGAATPAAPRRVRAGSKPAPKAGNASS